MRREMFAGNWKMNTTHVEGSVLAEGIVSRLSTSGSDVVLIPPFTGIESVSNIVHSSSVALGAQTMSAQDGGAFTGEISPVMLKSLGCDYVVLGHSERRSLFGETSAQVLEKAVAAVAHGITPIVCVGETLEERESGQALAVIETQVRESMVGLTQEVVVAYEPVWAIGTGKVATPEQAQEVHASIRSVLSDLFSVVVAEDTRILYGGSVKPDNVASIMAQADVDGALIGGASLNADAFVSIIEYNKTSTE
ncbi:triose-phosphate isomerase [bacterium]|jgi:triosephosphate isomerase (TIM)|nr:triose-phosphate isomerase [bacterium]